jgi:CheY-like chemotaxis protein
MVKRLVELHGGTIQVHSEGAGCGTRAEVRLPAALSPTPGSWSEPPAAVARGPLPARRIVVADDNRDAADSLANLLVLMGNTVETAYDGVDALEAVTRFRPHVVMLDIGMPRMNGHEVCRRIRELPGLDDVVLIAVTGWGQDEDRLRSQEAGFDLHLTKPIDPAAVEALLATLPAPRRPPAGDA